MEIRITVFDAKGNVVTDETSEAQTATTEQINEMVSLIEGGLPARTAALLVLSESQEVR